MEILDIIYRIIILFVVLYILARILNKKLISQMTFFDFVAGITLGSLTASTAISNNITLLVGILGIVLFATIIFIIDIISVKSFMLRKIFNSEPTILMNNGNILEEGMKRTRFTVNDLLLQLRKKNVFYLDEVDSAILETDGTVSVLKKPEKQTATVGDLNVKRLSRDLPQIIVMQGKILPNSLQALGKDEAWLNKILTQYQISNMKDVFVLQADKLGNVYIDTKTDTITFKGDE